MKEWRKLEAIKKLKYRYIRSLDLKLWDEMSACLTTDVKAAYAGGKLSFDGRDALLEFFASALGPNMITSHRVHQPEIELTGKKTATGIWALDDVVIETGTQTVIRGAAIYHDEYVREGGEWRICATGYERVYEERYARKDIPSLELTENRWA